MYKPSRRHRIVPYRHSNMSKLLGAYPAFTEGDQEEEIQGNNSLMPLDKANQSFQMIPFGSTELLHTKPKAPSPQKAKKKFKKYVHQELKTIPSKSAKKDFKNKVRRFKAYLRKNDIKWGSHEYQGLFDQFFQIKTMPAIAPDLSKLNSGEEQMPKPLPLETDAAPEMIPELEPESPDTELTSEADDYRFVEAAEYTIDKYEDHEEETGLYSGETGKRKIICTDMCFDALKEIYKPEVSGLSRQDSIVAIINALKENYGWKVVQIGEVSSAYYQPDEQITKEEAHAYIQYVYYAVGGLSLGFHAFSIAKGEVYEIHYGEDSKSESLYEKTAPSDFFLGDDYYLAIPPAELLPSELKQKHKDLQIQAENEMWMSKFSGTLLKGIENKSESEPSSLLMNPKPQEHPVGNIFSWPYPLEQEGIINKILYPSEESLMQQKKYFEKEEYKRLHPISSKLNENPFLFGKDIWPSEKIDLEPGVLKTSSPFDSESSYGIGFKLRFKL